MIARLGVSCWAFCRKLQSFKYCSCSTSGCSALLHNKCLESNQPWGNHMALRMNLSFITSHFFLLLHLPQDCLLKLPVMKFKSRIVISSVLQLYSRSAHLL